MAIDMTAGTAAPLAGSPMNHSPYVAEVVIDLAAVVTAKGSAIAQADVIECMAIPAGTMVLAAGVECITAMTGTSTDATVDLGFTGGDVDNYVDGFDLDAATAGTFSAAGVTEPIMCGTSDTLDLLVVTQTGTVLTGEFRVWALVVDVDGKERPGVASSGS